MLQVPEMSLVPKYFFFFALFVFLTMTVPPWNQPVRTNPAGTCAHPTRSLGASGGIQAQDPGEQTHALC